MPKTNNKLGSHNNNTDTEVLQNLSQICDVVKDTIDSLKVHHYKFSSESILEAYGIVTKNNVSIDTLNPKICPNCNEGNTQDAKWCSRCKMLISFEGYHEVLQEQQEKDKDLQLVKERMANIENILVAIQPLQNIKPEMLTKLQLVGINR